jgi:hypothetical protein
MSNRVSHAQFASYLSKHFTHQTPKQYRGDRPAITENQQSAQHNYHDRDFIVHLFNIFNKMIHFFNVVI